MSILEELKFIDHIEELTAMPRVAMDLMALLSNPETPVRDVVARLSLDAALAAFILRYCNSPLLAVRNQINSITQAVNLIGFTKCKSLLMSYFIRNMYNISGKKYINDFLFEHSLSTAIIARELAAHLGVPDRKEQAYLTGLLHDIGKLVLYVHDPVRYEQLIHRVDGERKTFIFLEERTYGYTHVETGYYLMNKWGFSDLLDNSLRYHHYFENYTGPDPLTGLAAFANSTFHYAIDKLEELPKQYLEYYHLSEQEYARMLDHIIHTVAQSQLIHFKV